MFVRSTIDGKPVDDPLIQQDLKVLITREDVVAVHGDQDKFGSDTGEDGCDKMVDPMTWTHDEMSHVMAPAAAAAAAAAAVANTGLSIIDDALHDCAACMHFLYIHIQFEGYAANPYTHTTNKLLPTTTCCHCAD
jgi:hypothetical protein